MSLISETLRSMRWAVEIQETALEPRNLADLLLGLGFTLVEAARFPAMTSAEMDLCTTPGDVFEMAKRVRAAFAGPADIDSNFRLGSVIDFSTDLPRRYAFLEVYDSVHSVSSCTATLEIRPPQGLSESEQGNWEADRSERAYEVRLEEQRARLEAAYWNESAAKVLEWMASKGPTGETLYKLYETLEGHPTRRAAFHANYGISKPEFQRFKDAVHNPAVTGDWARHAYIDPPRSNQPMSRSEAEAFVRRLATKWLAYARRKP